MSCQGIEILVVGQYGFVLASLLLVLCGLFVSFLLSFRLTLVFHSPPAPSSFVVIIIRIETQSSLRCCEAGTRGRTTLFPSH